MENSIKGFMSGDPVSIEADASALEALECMQERGIRHLPVLDRERRVVGIVSLEDLRAVLPFPVGLREAPSVADRDSAREWRVGDLMTHAPVTLREGDALAEAAERMAERRIGCLPIVDAEGRLAGMLTETDLLHALATMLWSGRVRERRKRTAAGDLTHLVAELQRERDALAVKMERYHAIERDLATHGSRDPLDFSEASSDLTELRVTEGLDALAARRLAALDHALARATQGRLGICERCGARIPRARLRALPGTPVCIACARSGPAA